MKGDGIILFNLICSVAVCIGLFLSVMSPRIKDGVIVKFGLIMMTIGFFFRSAGVFDGLIYGVDKVDPVYMSRISASINAGLIVVLVGYFVRTRAGSRKQRRVTDWADLDDPANFDRRRSPR